MTTPVAKRNRRELGYLAGHHLPFMPNHHRRVVPWTDLYAEGAPDECWLWRGSMNDRGYGVLVPIGRRTHQMAHRWVYEQRVGPIPAGHHLHHLCSNPRCVNPDHLVPLTPMDHLRADRAKLTPEDVRAIRADKTTSAPKLAARYGVIAATIRRVRNGESWRDDATHEANPISAVSG